MTHRLNLRVYYEDTDLAGIVYYANYLKYIERGRTEFVRSLGINQTQLRNDSGIVFAVRRVEADYLVPARFDDELCVLTTVVKVTGARIILRQQVVLDDTLLFDAVVTLVALTETGRPTRLPAELRQRFG